MYCEQCQGPVKDEAGYTVVRDGSSSYFFCNQKEARDWLENNPETSARIIMNDPELVEDMGW
ncbi:MAG TPA: hypothetical protein K8W06_04605 [Limosilactobacillus coleohominis]|nr:hypothetical protein [Limosilactobacillus coleohominis]